MARLSTVDRALGLLRLFTPDHSEWTVEAAARELGLSQSTAYQYVRSLVECGLLSTYGTGRYVVGPAIIELDRQTRRCDPLILAARSAMDTLAATLRGGDVVLLCRLYKLTVMCVDQRAPVSPRVAVSYERGLPMPLERGSASKVILAHLPPRVLRRFYSQTGGADGPDWAEFRTPLRAIRKEGLCITRGELDPGRTGVSAPVFGAEDDIVGSIGLVLSDECIGADDLARDKARVIEAGQRVSAAMKAVRRD